ncbi:carbonic anhydrase 4-like [Ptychodera flava]|uniref:carbonic anhydrase 4-like n=1 Tax=Ptychodera flava TaxID=63121 RepID=UPI00396AAC65
MGKQDPKTGTSCTRRGGDNQSPINIVRYEAQRKTMGEFIFVGFDDMPDDAVFVLENNGHTLSLGITGEFYIFGGGLPAKYKVVELHFHWDNLGIRGSEHAIDGMKYPLEMHLVSYNSEKYKDLTEAKMHSEGLAVLGTVIHIGGHDNEDYEPLLSGFHKVIYPGQTHTYSESFLF